MKMVIVGGCKIVYTPSSGKPEPTKRKFNNMVKKLETQTEILFKTYGVDVINDTNRHKEVNVEARTDYPDTKDIIITPVLSFMESRFNMIKVDTSKTGSYIGTDIKSIVSTNTEVTITLNKGTKYHIQYSP